jgi:hypothetical protein
MAVAVADLRISRRRRALERFVDSMNAGRKSINDAFDGIIAAAEEYEEAIALDPVSGEGTLAVADRTGGIKLAIEVTGMQATTIRALTRRGELPWIRVPGQRGSRGSVRYSERSLREWLKSHEVRPEAR